MHSGKKPVNCTPCAKRKVRCDKRQPCCHCKRRKGDVCVYPVLRANGPDSRPEDSSQRIEKLEVYIRRLGGDPQLIEQTVERGEANVKESSTCCLTTEARRIGDTASTSQPKDRTSCMKRREGPIGEQSGLVEHDEQVTYIEAYVPLRALAFSRNAANDSIPDQCGTAGAA
jgi:Fungal Zn(2)-Cys(6) binuclear cluster domain